MNKFSKYIISLFGIGFVPIAPGTVGSFISIIFFYLIKDYVSVMDLIFLFCGISLISLIFIEIYSSHIKKKDSSEIVIDEFLGILLIIIFYDFIKFTNDLTMFSIIFLLFRFFDILKFYPANVIDKKIKNSFGVVLDDLVAALYCIIILYILNVFI